MNRYENIKLRFYVKDHFLQSNIRIQYTIGMLLRRTWAFLIYFVKNWFNVFNFLTHSILNLNTASKNLD